MIHTTVTDLGRYSALNPYFPAAFETLSKMAAQPFVAGRHEVDGENIYVIALDYDTHPLEGAKSEAHKKYIDVMWIVSGKEQLGYYPTAAHKNITMEYNESNDCLLADIEKETTMAQFYAGDVVILFPEDGHAPGLDLDGTQHVQKLIAKVRVV